MAQVYRGGVQVSIEAVQRLSEPASLPTEVKEVGSSSLLVMRGGKLAEAPGNWSGVEGWQVSGEPLARPIRADPKRGG